MRFSTGRFIFLPESVQIRLPDYTLSPFPSNGTWERYNCFDLFSPDPVSIDAHCFFRIKICIFAFITIFKTVHGLADFSLINKNRFSLGNSVFSSCSLCSIPSSGLLMAFHIFCRTVPRYRSLSSGSLHRYLSQHISPHHRQGILEEIQCWITPLLFS